jgi:septum site-determining protein MinD
MAEIVSIHSFRRGTGKSGLAASLAALLALRGRRVALIDMAVQSPSLHILCGLHEDDIEYTLNDYLWGLCELAEAVYEVTPRLKASLDEYFDAASIKSAYKLFNPVSSEKRGTSSDRLGGSSGAGQARQAIELGTLYLVPASSNLIDIARMINAGYDTERFNAGLHALSARLALDVLVVDTNTGLSEETLSLAAVSDRMLILLRPDQQDFQGTAVMVDVARRLEVLDISLVVNAVPAVFDLAQVKAQVEETYACPVGAVLPYSEEMSALASQELFVLRYPEHPITTALRQLVTSWRQ